MASRTRLPMRSRSRRTRPRATMTATPRAGSGKRSRRSCRRSSAFAPASRARRARSTSGGAASTWLRASFQDARRRRIRAGCPGCRTGSRARPTAARCLAAASGPAEPWRPTPSSTATSTRNRRAIARRTSRTASLTRRLANSSCPMRTFAARTIPTRMLGEFLQSAYEAAANLAKWDRPMLEREPVAP